MTTEEVAPIWDSAGHTREAVWFPGHVWAARDMTRGLVPSTRPLMRNMHWLMEGGWMNGDRSDYSLPCHFYFLEGYFLFFLSWFTVTRFESWHIFHTITTNQTQKSQTQFSSLKMHWGNFDSNIWACCRSGSRSWRCCFPALLWRGNHSESGETESFGVGEGKRAPADSPASSLLFLSLIDPPRSCAHFSLISHLLFQQRSRRVYISSLLRRSPSTTPPSTSKLRQFPW